MDDFNSNRITRILTTDFPQYFAIITRIRQEVHAIGPEGGIVSSTVVPQVQAIFPEGALTKKIKVGLQVGNDLDTYESKATKLKRILSDSYSRFVNKLFKTKHDTRTTDQDNTLSHEDQTALHTVGNSVSDHCETLSDKSNFDRKNPNPEDLSNNEQIDAENVDEYRKQNVLKRNSEFQIWVLIKSKKPTERYKDKDHLFNTNDNTSPVVEDTFHEKNVESVELKPNNKNVCKENNQGEDDEEDEYEDEEEGMDTEEIVSGEVSEETSVDKANIVYKETTPRKNSIFHIVNIRPVKVPNVNSIQARPVEQNSTKFNSFEDLNIKPITSNSVNGDVQFAKSTTKSKNKRNQTEKHSKRTKNKKNQKPNTLSSLVLLFFPRVNLLAQI